MGYQGRLVDGIGVCPGKPELLLKYHKPTIKLQTGAFKYCFYGLSCQYGIVAFGSQSHKSKNSSKEHDYETHFTRNNGSCCGVCHRPKWIQKARYAIGFYQTLS